MKWNFSTVEKEKFIKTFKFKPKHRNSSAMKFSMRGVEHFNGTAMTTWMHDLNPLFLIRTFTFTNLFIKLFKKLRGTYERYAADYFDSRRFCNRI